METVAIPENEALLKDHSNPRGNDQGFGSMSHKMPKPQKIAHNRVVSTGTEISWFSNAFQRVSSRMSSYNTNSRSQTQLETRLQHILRILFEKDAIWLNLFLAICYTLVVLYSILIFVGPFLLHFFWDKEEWCYSRLTEEERDMFVFQDMGTLENTGERMLGGSADFGIAAGPYPNPDYNTDPCRYVRFGFLSYITLEECDVSRRLLTAVFLGGAIGYERRSADRPAGIRTMGLVSLGACFFTISSILAFKSSTQTWDASRVTAALPSGVGFLGGALIWKGSVFVGDNEMHQVHGLTTAASLWLSAAVGVGVGGALYLVTIYVTTLVILILRYGPRIYRDDTQDDDDDEDDDNDEGEEEEAQDKFDALGYSNPDRTQYRDSSPDRPAQMNPLTPKNSDRDLRRLKAQVRKSLREIPTFGS